MHGKISSVKVLNRDRIFEDVKEEFKVVRYHSLILEKIPPVLTVLAETNHKEIMLIKHNSLPIYGIQFHPEAVLSEFGEKIIQNWLSLFVLIK